MKTVKIDLYKFEELSEKVQNKLIEKEQEKFNEDGWITREDLREYFTYELSELGYPTENIEYSLSCCQGDGMAFYGAIDRDKLIEIRDRLFKDSNSKVKRLSKDFMYNNVRFSIGRTSYGNRYSHYNTMQVEFEVDTDSDVIYDLLAELREAILEDIRDVSKRLEQGGYSIIEGYDEEYFKEDLLNRDDWYTMDGEVMCDGEYTEEEESND
jgi:hypothetical protein